MCTTVRRSRRSKSVSRVLVGVCAIVVALLPAAAANAAEINIDTFDDGSIYDILLPGEGYASRTTSEGGLDTSQVLGGARSITIESFGSGGAGLSSYFVDSGVLSLGSVEAAPDYATRWTMDYALAGAVDLIGGPVANDAIAVEVLKSDHPYTLSLTMYDAVGSYTVDVARGASATAVDVVVKYAAFPGIDFANLTRATIVLEGVPDGDYTLGGVRAVPEPATVGLLAVGGVLVVWRKRRRTGLTAAESRRGA